jgi:methyl-accepting chemotaxis protein
MLRSSFLWLLVGSYAVVVLVTLVTIWWLIGPQLEKDNREDAEEELQALAVMFKEFSAPALRNPAEAAAFQAKLRPLGGQTGLRFTIIRGDGGVLADSEADPARMDNHGDRPEIQAARTQGKGSSERFSASVQVSTMFHALPVEADGKLLGYVRVGIPLKKLEERQAFLRKELFIAGGIAGALALAFGFVSALKVEQLRRNLRLSLEASEENRRQREGLLQNIREAVGQLSAASAEILATTAQQASGAREQAAAVAQVVATVTEVTQTADQAAQRIKVVGDAAQQNLEVGKAGRKAIEEALAAKQRVKEQVEATAENILALAEQAQAIGEIIATVTDIAEQTNLLALNAAIEASRAGEHGRGFAVVAGEVKTLADQSKKATVQVRQILGEIQKATNAAVISTEDVTKSVAAAIRQGAQAGETINTLTDTLGQTEQVAIQIVASAGQQAMGMAQINQAMKNIDQAARQNLAAMQQSEQAVQNLNGLGAQLSKLFT